MRCGMLPHCGANSGGKHHSDMGLRADLDWAKKRYASGTRGAIPVRITTGRSRTRSGSFPLSVQERDIPLEPLEKELLVPEKRVKGFLAIQRLEGRPQLRLVGT